MSNTTNAMSSLLRTSALAFHEEFIAQHVNIDSHEIDDTALDEWRWSDGERVLVNVLKVIARGHGWVRLDDLFKLDKPNQEAVLLALRIRFGLMENIGAEAGVL